ncbi:hypothetical protein O3P69_002995 [Scylla paramamosain]|uniref:Uncharacterized protein n=1 Tax=Scylla paramamosain TaxID=85552 RepID=A0AAW0ULY5_SCYPA
MAELDGGCGGGARVDHGRVGMQAVGATGPARTTLEGGVLWLLPSLTHSCSLPVPLATVTPSVTLLGAGHSGAGKLWLAYGGSRGAGRSVLFRGRVWREGRRDGGLVASGSAERGGGRGYGTARGGVKVRLRWGAAAGGYMRVAWRRGEARTLIG